MSGQCEYRVLYMTNGVGSRKGGDPTVREKEMRRANEILGYAEWAALDLMDNQLDQYPMLTLAQRIEYYVGEWKPQAVITHSLADLNIDHRKTAEAVLVACRPFACEVRGVFGFEVLSSTECGVGRFDPRFYMPIDIEKKHRAVACYKSEMRVHPHPRSIVGVNALAIKRGTECGMAVAEAFEVYRCTMGV